MGVGEEGGVIEKISVAWGDSGGIERHRTSCAGCEDRTGSHKRSFLVDGAGAGAGTYIGHPKTWAGRTGAVEVVASRKGG